MLLLDGTITMNLAAAALLYFGGGILLTFGVVWAYVTIIGDETGEKILPVTKKVSLYPFTAPPYDPDKYQNATNNTRNSSSFTPSPEVQTQLNKSNMTIGDLIGLNRSNAGFISPYSLLAEDEELPESLSWGYRYYN